MDATLCFQLSAFPYLTASDFHLAIGDSGAKRCHAVFLTKPFSYIETPPVFTLQL